MPPDVVSRSGGFAAVAVAALLRVAGHGPDWVRGPIHEGSPVSAPVASSSITAIHVACSARRTAVRGGSTASPTDPDRSVFAAWRVRGQCVAARGRGGGSVPRAISRPSTCTPCAGQCDWSLPPALSDVEERKLTTERRPTRRRPRRQRWRPDAPADGSGCLPTRQRVPPTAVGRPRTSPAVTLGDQPFTCCVEGWHDR